MSRAPLMNFRVPPEMGEVIDEAWRHAGYPNRSAWALRILEAAALAELNQPVLAGRQVRIEHGLDAMVMTAAVIAGTSTEEWVAEALEAGARREMSATAGVRRSSLSRAMLQPSGCQHPPTARWLGVEVETCTECGSVTRRLL